jgi:hypothetical protein
MVEPGGESLEVTHTVGIGVAETADVHLVDDGVAVPLRILPTLVHLLSVAAPGAFRRPSVTN